MSKQCFFCSSEYATKELPFVIPQGMKGVILNVCVSCFDEHGNISYSDDDASGSSDDDDHKKDYNGTRCNGDKRCLLTGEYLVLNPRMKHRFGVKFCVYDMTQEEIDEAAPSEPPPKCLAIYYNELTNLYEMNDTPYEEGEDGFAEQLGSIDKNDYVAVSKLIAKSSNINCGLGGININGSCIIDWAAANGFASLIRAIGELRPGQTGSDNAFASAVEREDVDMLYQLIKYNLIENDGSTAGIGPDDKPKVSAYEIGMRSTNPRIRSLVLMASINPEMRRALNLDLNKNIELTSSQ